MKDITGNEKRLQQLSGSSKTQISRCNLYKISEALNNNIIIMQENGSGKNYSVTIYKNLLSELRMHLTESFEQFLKSHGFDHKDYIVKISFLPNLFKQFINRQFDQDVINSMLSLSE